MEAAVSRLEAVTHRLEAFEVRRDRKRKKQVLQLHRKN